jgi:hypothetical protein
MITTRRVWYLLVTAVLLLGLGTVGYGVLVVPRPVIIRCRETILDPDLVEPDRSGSLHLHTCPVPDGISVDLEVLDYARRPPVVGYVFGGTLPSDSPAAGEPLRARWVGLDILRVELAPDLRVDWRSTEIGPIRVAFVRRSPAG